MKVNLHTGELVSLHSLLQVDEILIEPFTIDQACPCVSAANAGCSKEEG